MDAYIVEFCIKYFIKSFAYGLDNGCLQPRWGETGRPGRMALQVYEVGLATKTVTKKPPIQNASGAKTLFEILVPRVMPQAEDACETA